MATYVAPADSTPHHDNVLRTLSRLVECEDDTDDVEFFFEVPLQRYSVLARGGCLPVMSGDLTLAIYNDLKLSQYIIEDDNLTTYTRRCFSLTDRGRRVASLSVDT